MRAILIYNPSAGGRGSASSEQLLSTLVDAGFDAEYRPTASESDLDLALEGQPDLFVVAGGDGTTRAVATRIVGRGIPMALIPMGTSNNIAHSLGQVGKPLELCANLATPRKTAFDLGRARGSWGETLFLEAVGWGLFAETLYRYDPDAPKSPIRGAQAIIGALGHLQAKDYRLTIDGQPREGRYLLIEAMNTPMTGNSMRLAPQAKTDDGLLEVVLIEEGGRVGLLNYLMHLVAGKLEEIPTVSVVQCKTFSLEWDGAPLHLDAEVKGELHSQDPSQADLSAANVQPPSKIDLDLMPARLELWLSGNTNALSQA